MFIATTEETKQTEATQKAQGYDARVETFGGYCSTPETKQVVFDFPLFSFWISKDGSTEVRPKVPEEIEGLDARRSLQGKSHITDPDTNLGGAHHQPDYEALGYLHQDIFTQTFANAEHVALHLWIEQMRNMPITRADEDQSSQLATMITQLVLLSKPEIKPDSYEEYFVTGIQLLANGIQPELSNLSVIGAVADSIGLSGPIATVSALAFVNYLRGYLRKTFSPEVK